MLTKLKTWFSGLTKAGKAGVILASLFVVGAAASPTSNTNTNTQTGNTNQNTQTETDTVEKKTVTETEAIEFNKTTVEDGSMNKGETAIQTAGVAGVKTLTYEVTFTNGVETGKKLTKEEITKEPVNEVTLVGTYVYKPPAPAQRTRSDCDPNYKPCVPNVSYDLDCPDIGFSVTVIGSDPHGFDGNDNDGYGCESY